MSIFSAHEARMAEAHDRIFGRRCALQPMLSRINEEAIPDPERDAIAELTVIWESDGARINAGDNGVGGSRPGGFRMAHAAREVFVSIRRGQVPYELRVGDRLTDPARPGKIWSIAEPPMPQGSARERVRLNEVA